MTKSKKIRLIVFGAVVLLILFGLVCAMAKRKGGSIVIQTEKATKGKVVSTVSGTAKIQPEVQVKISAKVSGQILRLGVQEGDRVSKGQFLVQLDPEFYKADVEQSSSNQKFARAGHEKAKNEYERMKKLFDQQLSSVSELEIAKSTYEQSKAQVEQSDAMLKQAQDNLSKTTIYSPMDGIVSQVNKKVGEMAMGSQFTLDVIMVVADLSKMLAETEIDENDVVSVTLKDTAKIEIDAFPDTTFKGVVKEIANTGTTKGTGTQEEVTNFLVKVFMIEKPPTIRPSMSSNVDIITEVKDGVVKVPIQCVTVRQPLAPKADPKSKKKAKAETEAEAKAGAKSDSTAKGKAEAETKADGKPGQKAEAEAKAKAGAKSDSTAKGDSTAKSAPPPPAGEGKPVKVVFLVKAGFVKQVPVETGISSDTDIEIIKGLSEGDEIVSGPYRLLSKQLKDGDKIRVNNALKQKFSEDRERE